jgi:hypothetical protein
VKALGDFLYPELGFGSAKHRTLRDCFVHFFKSGALRVAALAA